MGVRTRTRFAPNRPACPIGWPWPQPGRNGANYNESLAFNVFVSTRVTPMQVRVLLLALLACVLGAGRPAAAQFKDMSPAKGAHLGTPVTHKLKVGVIIKAQGGQLLNLLGTALVPIEWPEQTVRIADEELTPNVPSLHYRVSGVTLKQMMIEVPMITAGEEARALVTFEVSHAPQTPPTDTNIYKIPKKLDRQ